MLHDTTQKSRAFNFDCHAVIHNHICMKHQYLKYVRRYNEIKREKKSQEMKSSIAAVCKCKQIKRNKKMREK